MPSLIQVLIAVLAGFVLGLLVTRESLGTGQGDLVIGPWRSQPRDNSGGVDPYVLAATARAGLLPLGAGEGLGFIAATDSAKAPFDAACDYGLKGPMPPARYWTVSLLTPKGFPMANPASRFAITSGDALRFNSDPVVITIAPEARAGNWLPTGHAEAYVVMLRLYDTGLTDVGTHLDAAALPSIVKGHCR